MEAQQEQQKKRTPTEVIFNLAHYHNQKNTGDFWKEVMLFCQSLGSGNSMRYRIQRLYNERPMEMRVLDNMHHSIKNLVLQGQVADDNVFVPEHTHKLLSTLMLEWKNIEAFKMHNLKTRNKILFYGETGNGKTTIARHIAKIAELPFVEIKSEEVIDSHLGSTSTNIHRVLNEITQPCVLFWDEIDSIGCKRGNDVKSSAGHENDRMTNTLLVNMDRLGNQVIFIGATNRPQVLDSAFRRRFDVEHEIKPPTLKQKNAFIDQCETYYKTEIIEEYKKEMRSMKSYYEIRAAIVSYVRDNLMSLIQHGSLEINKN